MALNKRPSGSINSVRVEGPIRTGSCKYDVVVPEVRNGVDRYERPRYQLKSGLPSIAERQ